MADDSFFGGLQSRLQDLLPNKITYATPEQIRAIRGTGENLYASSQHPGIYTWGNVFGDIASKLSGAAMMRRAGELERGGLEKGAEALTSSSPSGATPAVEPSVSSPPTDASASSGSSASSTAPASNQASSTPGEPSAPPPAWAQHAANMTSEYETGQKNPMVGLVNVSPDTPNKDGTPSYSYGNLGLNSLPGNAVHEFQKKYGNELGLTAKPGTEEFRLQWRNIASDGDLAPVLRAKETEWYNDKIASKVPERLKAAGVPDSLAADPRVLAYFSDRSVQHDVGAIDGRHKERIAAAAQASGGDPQRFIALAAADEKRNIGGDFQTLLSATKDDDKKRQLITGLLNRVDKRQAGALGYSPPGAPGAPSAAAIAPMVNAIAGTPTAGAQPSGAPGASIVPPNVSPGAPATTGTPGAPGNLRQMLTALGSPGPSVSPTGAIGGAPPMPIGGPIASPPGAGGPLGAPPGAGAPNAAAMPQAVAGPQAPGAAGAAGRKPDIPPSMPMSSLPSDAQIQSLMKSNISQYVERGKELSEYKQKMLTPQQVSTPDGSIFVGTPYTGYSKLGIQGMPQFIKSPFKVPGAYEGEQISMLGTVPGGGPAMVPVPTIQPPGAGAPAAAGGTPGAGELPPMPPTSDIPGMAAWGTQVTAARKAAEATSEELAKGAAKPMTEAMEKAATTPDMIRKLDIMSNAYRQGAVSGGPLGPYLHDVRGVAAQLGLIDPKDKTLTAQNIIEKVGAQLAFQATKELTTRPAASEVLIQIKNNPGLMMNTQAATYMLDLMKQTALQDQKIGQIAMIPGMTPSRFAEMRDNYYRDNPLTSPFTHRPINEVGGGIPGTKNGPPPQAPGVAPGAPPGPAVGTVRNGYRFKGGDPAQQTSWEAVQ